MSVEPKPLTPIKVTNRTIYDASAREVFFKNLLAGMGIGLGQVFIYLLFLSGALMLAIRFVWPVVEPYVQTYQRSMESIQQIQSWIPGSSNSVGQNVESPEENQGFNIQFNPNQLNNFLPQERQETTQ